MTSGTIEIRNSITVESSAHWGADRIVVDMLQNHQPGDSGGTDFQIKYLIDDVWIPHEEINGQVMKAKAVAITDDGRGYDYRKLGLEFSDKPENNDDSFDSGAAGRFGEGLKRLCAATVGNGNGSRVLLQSRNWIAEARIERVVADELTGKTAGQLVFSVDLDGSNTDGSVTMIWDPPKDILACLSRADKKVLLIRRKVDNTPPLFRNDKHGEILATNEGEPRSVYSKGLHVTDDYSDRLLYSYNLNVVLNRDRDHIKEWELNNALGVLLRSLDDKEVIKKLLHDIAEIGEGNGDDNCHTDLLESGALYWKEGNNGSASGGLRPEHPELWVDAFRELFGDKAVACGLYNVKQARVAELAGYRPILLPDGAYRFLGVCGVKKAEDIHNDVDIFILSDENECTGITGRTVETPITLRYRAKKWDITRALLDIWSNHVPSDSGGKRIDVEVYARIKRDGYWRAPEWVGYGALPPESEVLGIRFSDDGEGYSNEHLRLLLSSKTGDDTVGKYGEGLKLLCAAALRDKKIKVKVKSRNWAAAPVELTQTVEQQGRREQVPTLNYRLIEGLPDMHGSSTTITRTEYSQEFDQIVKGLRNKILMLMPEFSDEDHSVAFDNFLFRCERVGAPVAKIFNKGVVLPGFTEKILFNYNLTLSDMSPERDYGSHDETKEQIREILSRETRKGVIKRILKTARESPGAGYLEFMNIPLTDEAKTAWKEAFYELNGPRAVLHTSGLSNMEAVHHGYEPIQLHEAIRDTLKNAGVLTDREAAAGTIAEFDEVDKAELTPEELRMLGRYQSIERILGLPQGSTPRVFSKAWNRWGEEELIGGFARDGEVWLKREVLGEMARFVITATHERGHAVTGARDPEDGFRGFFEAHLTAFVIGQIEAIEKGEPPQTVQVSFDAITNTQNAQLRAELSTTRARLAALKEKVERLPTGEEEDGVIRIQEESQPAPFNAPIMSADLGRLKAAIRKYSDYDYSLDISSPFMTMSFHGVNIDDAIDTFYNILNRRRCFKEWLRVSLMGSQNRYERKVEIEIREDRPRFHVFDPDNARAKLRLLYKTLRKNGHGMASVVRKLEPCQRSTC